MKKAFHFLIFTFVFLAACQKDKLVWEEVYFEFEMPFKITPLSDTINIGDTLTMETTFSDTLYDRKSRNNIYLPNYNFVNLFACHELKSDSTILIKQPAGLDKFYATSYLGSFTITSNKFANLIYEYSNGKYKSKVVFIPKAKGVFAIMLFAKNPNGLGLINLPQSLAPHSPGVKRFPVIQFNRYVFNNGNTKQHIFLQHCKQIEFTDSISLKNSTEFIYTFVVK